MAPAVALPAGSGKAPPPPAGVTSVDDCVELSGAWENALLFPPHLRIW